MDLKLVESMVAEIMIWRAYNIYVWQENDMACLASCFAEWPPSRMKAQLSVPAHSLLHFCFSLLTYFFFFFFNIICCWARWASPLITFYFLSCLCYFPSLSASLFFLWDFIDLTCIFSSEFNLQEHFVALQTFLFMAFCSCSRMECLIFVSIKT